ISVSDVLLVLDLKMEFNSRTNCILSMYFPGKLVQIPQLLILTLFTDEASFSKNAIMNFHNNHLCDPLIGPSFLPGRLAWIFGGRTIANNAMWLMHDGALAHFSEVVRDFLTQTYGNRWIGRGGPHLWPARSPDLNPLDFFLWGGHLKSLLYNTPLKNVEDLRNRIIAGCNSIRNDAGVFERVRLSMRRLDSGIRVGGGHSKQFL
ncbi:hypothetical protein NQ317_013074, partial [Molorchus minor]